MRYTVSSEAGDSVVIEAENFLIALGRALAHFELGVEDIGRWVLSPGSDGSVFVNDLDRGGSWMVRPAPEIVHPRTSEQVTPELGFSLEPDASERPPPVQMPRPSMIDTNPFSNDQIAERLFDLFADIAGASHPDEACTITVRHVAELVPATGCCLTRGTLRDSCMTVVAAQGALAEVLMGSEVLFGAGLLGLCMDTGMAMHARDPDAHQLAHLPPGTSLQGLLCVPVLDDYGVVHGVLQVFDPPADLDGDASQAVEAAARALAATLAAVA